MDSVDDNDVVLLYLDISEQLKQIESVDHLRVIQWLEKEYINEADSPLGDFLNDICLVYLNYLYNDEIHEKIRDVVYDHDLDYDMIYEVGNTILEHQLLQTNSKFMYT